MLIVRTTDGSNILTVARMRQIFDLRVKIEDLVVTPSAEDAKKYGKTAITLRTECKTQPLKGGGGGGGR